VTVSGVVFAPAAPLLVPDVAGGSAGLDEAMRAASVAAVTGAITGRCDEVIVVAASAHSGEHPPEATWDFGGFGVPRRDVEPDRPRLPPSLGIGAWLLDAAGWSGPRRYVGVAEARDLDLVPARSSVVVAVGDGSACRTERAPGYLDDRAEPFDTTIATALADGALAALTGLDDALAVDLLCHSLPVWRTVASALDDAPVIDSTLDLHVAPYGVAYFVARWSLSCP
jgi:hypothetical protein